MSPNSTAVSGELQSPSWHDRPTCSGWWICASKRYGNLVCVVTDPSLEMDGDGRLWYGPIPEPPATAAKQEWE